jgi:aldose 1-epimerase
LHGGPTGYDIRRWLPITRDQSALFASGNPSVEPGKGQEAIFQLRSPEGDQGFPEDVIIEAFVAVVGPNTDETGSSAAVAGEVYYNLRAAIVPGEDGSDKVRGTPINLTVHWGFNLEGGRDVLNHLLWLDVSPNLPSYGISPYASTLIFSPGNSKSDERLELDLESRLSTGKTVPVRGTPWDFTSPKAIGSDPPPHLYGQSVLFLLTIAGQLTLINSAPLVLDDNFILSRESVDSGSAQAKLGSLANPISLAFASNQSSVMVYTGGFFDGSGTRKSCHGKVDEGYPKYGPSRKGIENSFTRSLFDLLKRVFGFFS